TTFVEMIRLFCSQNRVAEAVAAFEECKRLQMADRFVYSSMLKTFIANNRDDDQDALWSEMKEANVALDLVLYTNYVESLLSRSKIDAAFELLDDMSQHGVYPDAIMIQAVLDGCCKAGYADRAFQYLRECSTKGQKISMAMYRTVLEGLSKSHDEDKVYVLYDLMKGMKLIPPIYNIVLRTASDHLNLDMFRLVWKEFLRNPTYKPNQISYTIALKLHTKLKNIDEAKLVCQEMLAQKLDPSLETMVQLIEAAIQARRYSDASEILSWLRKFPSGKGKDLSPLFSAHMAGFKELVVKLSETKGSPEQQRRNSFMIIDTYMEVLQKSGEADELILRSVMDAYRNVKDLVGVVRTWTTLEKHFPQPEASSLESLLKSALRLGQEKTAVTLVKMVQDSDKYTINQTAFEHLLALCAKYTDGLDIPSLLLDMMNKGYTVDDRVWRVIKVAFMERKAREGNNRALADKGVAAFQYVVAFVEENFPEIMGEETDSPLGSAASDRLKELL
ncbi:hypothetical protein HDU91_005947, partial [Kappamyces sp. JEL0680]